LPTSSSLETTPPNADEIEVSLFGPGLGEAVLVHVGAGEWIVVDSCLDRFPRRPVALRYLESLGCDPASAIRLVVATHWHDDHIGGLAAIVRATPQAKLICSAALTCKEFLQVVASGDRAMMVSPGSAEFGEVFAILRERRSGARAGLAGAEWARADQRLWLRSGAPFPAEVWALSPSAESMTLAMNEFAQLLPTRGTPKRRLVAQRPNEVAVVLWIEAGGLRTLLGADLENSGNPKTGWQAVLGSAARPAGAAHVFKVPHHGSRNGDHPNVWAGMLVGQPHTALTPYTRGVTVPTAGDLARLRGRTPNLYMTAQPGTGGGWAPPQRDGAVEKTLKEVTRGRRALTGAMGHVRLRAPAGDPSRIRVELFHTAHRL
jgi:beta-lactamase superfamily II metal-dependent hydrolase